MVGLSGDDGDPDGGVDVAASFPVFPEGVVPEDPVLGGVVEFGVEAAGVPMYEPSADNRGGVELSDAGLVVKEYSDEYAFWSSACPAMTRK